MYLIIGLGNPGRQYEGTRHNVGFMVVDEFARQHDFPEFQLSKRHSSLLSEGILNQETVVLAKPQTFMNNSGKAVKALMSNVKCQMSNVIIVHDDIDIKLGEIKVSQARGTAGHKGVESIVQSLGTKDFTRVRVGIQPEQAKPEDVENFVLRKFAKEDLPVVKDMVEESVRSLESLVGLKTS